jgi:lipoprotein-anchoring transpeptidase ErfK/SrfK
VLAPTRRERVGWPVSTDRNSRMTRTALHSSAPGRKPFLRRALVRAAAALALSTLTGGCIQFHLSDGSGGIYEKGTDVFSAPARIFGLRPKPGPPAPPVVAKLGGRVLLVDKSRHRLYVYADGKLRRQYEVALGRHAGGPKVREGDRRTPEGVYRILAKKDRGQTRFHRALLIDYPNARDRAIFVRAKAEGRLPKGAHIGGLIEIHGGGTGFDWTNGCIALENRDIDDLWKRVRVGTPIVIVGKPATTSTGLAGFTTTGPTSSVELGGAF